MLSAYSFDFIKEIRLDSMSYLRSQGFDQNTLTFYFRQDPVTVSTKYGSSTSIDHSFKNWFHSSL